MHLERNVDIDSLLDYAFIKQRYAQMRMKINIRLHWVMDYKGILDKTGFTLFRFMFHDS